MSQVPSDAAWHIFGQLMAALGQGAGGMHVTTDAIKSLAATYMATIASREAEWPTIEVATMAFARDLGRMSAHLALGDHRAHVTAADLTEATRSIRPLLPCPMCIDTRLAPPQR